MSSIDSINQSLSEMSSDELLERMRLIRTARRIPTEIPRHAKKAKKPAVKMAELVKNLTDDQLASLIAELEA